MKQLVLNVQVIRIAIYFIILTSPLSILHAQGRTDSLDPSDRIKLMEREISLISEKYIGIPYQLGGDPRTSGTADNSHLICAIYEEAAQKAGLTFTGYMPMKNLLALSQEIPSDEIRNGDLIVLNNGHAALIYRVDTKDGFHMLYASGKRQQIVAFNSQNLVYEVYWLKNLKGFYRPEQLFSN